MRKSVLQEVAEIKNTQDVKNYSFSVNSAIDVPILELQKQSSKNEMDKGTIDGGKRTKDKKYTVDESISKRKMRANILNE